jgi:hypothetical protein
VKARCFDKYSLGGYYPKELEEGEPEPLVKVDVNKKYLID